MNAVEFYKTQNYPKANTITKKEKVFTYGDMIEFAQNYHFSKTKKHPTIKNIGRYTLRLFGFPFFTLIAFGFSVYLFLKFIIGFARFGGEAIAYTKYTNYKTIADVYTKVCELNNIKTE